MRFRPCIDIHNGKVKQIVGGSLTDRGNQAEENFVSEQDSTYYARLYQERGLKGGHIIQLNSPDSEYYAKTKAQALAALRSYPQGLQAGGGITPQNAEEYLDAGASHVIVTSYVFRDGEVDWERLEQLCSLVGRERLVLDLSCRKRKEAYYIVTDRWQKFTNVQLVKETIQKLESYCDELLVHAVDVEGKASGIETELVRLLERSCRIPITYAGGVGSLEDLGQLKEAGKGRVDVTIGSALDLFGGPLGFEEVLDYITL